MTSLAQRLQAAEAAGLSKSTKWMAVRAAMELDAGHADDSQRNQLQCHRCGEVSERLEAVRPALGALLDGCQPSGAMRRRRNNALRLAAGGRRLGFSSGSGGGSDGSGSSGTSDHQRVPAITSEPAIDEYYGIQTADSGSQTLASFPPDSDVWFGRWVPELDAEHADGSRSYLADSSACEKDAVAACPLPTELNAEHALVVPVDISYSAAISACAKELPVTVCPGPSCELDAEHAGAIPDEIPYNAAISTCGGVAHGRLPWAVY